MPNLNYQNPASADAILQSEVADASTSPATLREKVALDGSGIDQLVEVLQSILVEMRLQNYILIKAFGVSPDQGFLNEGPDSFAG